MSNSTIDRTMQVQVEPVAKSSTAEVIAGYQLIDLLGSGGYGEVWRGVGPGGLHKAIKILFGQKDGPAADVELKALERVREVRHPFLLNLERIEIVDGRVIVVTELAERSLEDRFEEVQAQSGRGIPRDELLGYLRDVADALDYMLTSHGLQHLDIKPGNLLIQGGHIKVGDFGLTKDVRQSQQSLISGFTPLYVPPELLSGGPSETSDQYSLAVLYQYMLTGVPPFLGRTAAQLTAQHLHSKPDLSPLPVGDRPIIERALAKNPKSRFRSCRQFVDQLCGAASFRRQHVGVERDDSLLNSPIKPLSSEGGESTAVAEQDLAPFKGKPAVAVEVDRPRYRPTVYIGVGGLGVSILQSLQHRIQMRFGKDTEIPAWRFVYVDSDVKLLNNVRLPGAAASAQAVVPVPLLSASDYRTESKSTLQWLSRRWLYNIPKSGQVEGIRPLGRLAMASHHDDIRASIREQILKALDPKLRTVSEKGTGVPFDSGTPDIVLVASSAGGTGSGCIVELGYMTRSVLQSLGVPAARLTGVLVHWTSFRDKARMIQKANTVACLKELSHFAVAGLDYPGDSSCGLSRCHDGPFTETYVTSLGDRLDDAECDRRVSELAEYLYRDSASRVKPVLQTCRAQAERHGAAENIRSFAVHLPALEIEDSVAVAADQASVLVLRRWAQSDAELPAEVVPEIGKDVAKKLAEIELGPKSLVGRTTALLQGQPARQILLTLKRRIDKAVAVSDAALLDSVKATVGNLGAEFAEEATEGANDPLLKIRQLMRDEIAEFGMRCQVAIRENVLERVNRSRYRLRAAGEAADRFAAGVREVCVQLDSFVTAFEGEQRDLQLALGIIESEPESVPVEKSHAAAAKGQPPVAKPLPSREELADNLNQYAMLMMCQFVYRSLRDQLVLVGKSAADLPGILKDLKSRFGMIERQFDVDLELANEDIRPEQVEAAAKELDEQLGQQRQWNLVALLKITPAEIPAFCNALRDEARAVMATSLTGDLGHSEAGNEDPFAHCESLRLSDGVRVLCSLPSREAAAEWKRRLEGKYGACVTPMHDPKEPAFVCCEAEGLNLDALIGRVAGNDETILSMADRLHTRTDIRW